MRTQAQIRIGFESAKARAGELEESADTLRRKCAKAMESTLLDLGAGWRGESAIRFGQKAAQLQRDMEKSVMELRLIAETIRRNAKILYDAEMQAARIAKQDK